MSAPPGSRRRSVRPVQGALGALCVVAGLAVLGGWRADSVVGPLDTFFFPVALVTLGVAIAASAIGRLLNRHRDRWD